MSEWSTVRLGDLAKWLSGGTPSTSEISYWGGSIPWISAASMKDFFIGVSDRNVTEEGVANGTRLVPPGTIIFMVRGMSLMSEFRIGITIREVAFGQDCKALIPNRDVDPFFLVYAIKAQTPKILDLVDAAGHGTGRLQTDRIADLRILIPASQSEQRRYADVARALDDKIAVNERIMHKSDALVREIFRHDFVRPSRDVLPHGWDMGSLADICETQYGYTASSVDEVVGPKLLRVKDINKHNWVDWEFVPYCEIADPDRAKYSLAIGDVVVARMADPGKSAIIESPVDAVFASYLVRLKTKSIAHSYYVYGFLKSDEYAEYAAGARGGSVQANMNAKVIVGARLPIPPTEILEAHLAQILPLRRRLVASLHESSTLAKLRDSLLPKLMSGEIRVRDAEKLVEDVT